MFVYAYSIRNTVFSPYWVPSISPRPAQPKHTRHIECMKLKLPHKFQAALVAAIASVSFTTVSSASLGAGAFLLSTQHAAAQDTASNSLELNYNASVIEELTRVLQDLDEEKLAETTTTANEVGTGGVDDILQALNEIDSQEVVSPMAAGENIQPAAGYSGVENHESFTDNSYSGTSSNGSEETAAPVAATYTPVLAQAPAASAAQGTASTSGSNFSGLGVSTGDSAAGIGSASLGITGGGDSSVLAAPALLGAIGGDSPQQLNVTKPDGGALSASRSSIDWENSGTTGNLSSWSFTFVLDPQNASKNFFNLAKLGSGGGDSFAGYHLGNDGATLYLAADGSSGNHLIELPNALNGSTSITIAFVRDMDQSENLLNTGTFYLYTGTTEPSDPSHVQVAAADAGNNANCTTFYHGTGTDDSSTRIWTNSAAQLFSGLTLYKLSDHVIEIETLVWAGTGANYTWQASGVWEDGKTFDDGDNASFTSTADSKKVLVSSTIAAGVVTVSDAYEFDVEGNASLTARSLAGDGSLKKAGAGTMTISGPSANFTGAVEVSEGTLRVTNADSAAKMLQIATGSGVLELGENVTLANDQFSQMAGTLSIMEGKTLNMGGAEGHQVSIDSFSKVVLDGAQITYNAAASTINGVTVNSGKTGKIKVEDLDTGDLVLGGTTTVNGTLELSNHWNSQFKINKLVGDGTLTTKKDGAAQWMTVTIDSLSDGDQKFTGALNFAHNNSNNKEKILINTGDQNVSFRSLSLDYPADRTMDFTLGADAAIAQMTLTSGTANIAGDHQLTVGTLSGSGPMNVAANVTLNGTNEYTGAINVNSGTLDLTSTVGTGNFSVAQGATLKLEDANLLSVTGDLTLASGSMLDLSGLYEEGQTLTLATHTGRATYEGVIITGLGDGRKATLKDTGNTLQVTFGDVLQGLTWNGASQSGTWGMGSTSAQNWKDADGASVRFTESSNALFTSDATQKTVTISSNITAGIVQVSDAYTFRFSGSSNRTLTATELRMDNGDLILQSSSTNRSHKLSITGDLSGKGTVDIKANTTLAVGGNISIAAGDTLTITNENTSTAVTANGLQADGTLVKSGNGALTITGNADSFISAPISLTGGTLTLNGSYNLDGMTPASKVEGYRDGTHNGNGFKYLESTLLVVDKSAGATLSAGSATFSYDGLTGTGLNGNGQITFDHTDYTTFYVNESGNAESLANAVNKAGSHSSPLTSIQLADGTALNVDTDATLAGTLTVDGSATLTHTGSSDNTLQVAALSLAAGDSLTLEDGVNLALSDRLVGEQHLEGLKLEEGSTLTLKLYNQWDDPQSGNNNFKNAVMLDPTSCGIVDVKQGSISYYSELGTSVLHLGEGAELQFADNPAGTHHTGQDHALFENDIVLDGDAAVATHGTTKHIDCTVSGDIYGEDYTLTHTHDGNLLLDFTGTVILGEYYNNDTRNEYGYHQNSRFSGEFKIGTVTTVRNNDDISHTEFCGHGEVGTIRGAGYVHLTDYTPNDGDQSTLTIIGTVEGTGADAFTGTFRQGAGGLIIADGANVDFSNVDYLQQNDYPERKFDGYLEVEKNGILTLGSGTILGDITTAGTLTFAKTLDLSADVVTQTDGVINVNSGATVTFKEGTLTSAIQNSGTVNLDKEGSMDVSALPLEGGGKRVYYNTEGGETTRKSYFLGVTKGYVTVVDNSGGGSYNTGAMASFYGATYALQNQGGNGIIPFDEQIFYETYYHGENEKITVSEIKSGIPGTTTEELQRVVLTDGELDVNSNVPTVDSSNATVSLNGGTITDLNVQGATTVNGDLSKDTNLNIDHAQVATLTDGLTRDGVTFSHGAQITNTAHDRTTYSLGNEDARVTADSITAKNNSDVTIGNLLDVPTVTNEGPGKLTISNGDDRLKEINATGGDIEFQNMGSDTVALDNVSIGTGNTLKILEDFAEAASVSVSDTLTVGSGAAMKADVTMKDRSTLDVSASGGTNGLNLLESTLTMQTGVGLSEDDIAAIERMSPNSNYDLAYGLTSLILGETPWTDPIKASDLFANFPTTGDPNTDWYVYYSGTEAGGAGGNVGTFYIYKAPEPTTGTLSLLSLCALTARRRRRN